MMIVIEVVDWLAAVSYICAGVVPLNHVIIGVVMPPLYVAALTWGRLRGYASAPDSSQTNDQRHGRLTGA
ncbi:hypothetical protein MSAS_26870 [Mycobacterium saskatchewanense]|uniref:Uncharacterized protein n=1 Tax=Mycobacterium saskatchewanense TaxID=220927 RepID=A0AAJ3NRL4_9MYCO|nr:hypothetical protein [Mycobacterium saskatchewanense]ORW71690.1 hypothetical protein AWC23_13050 [Mycobacterium saskatchewanense]BBX63513.1 hypothetical protein MSAS_26870 [Mycobacterium saskatchewanense]